MMDAFPGSEERKRMKVTHYQDTTAQPVQMDGARDCQVRWLIGAADGAPGFAMRQFEVAPGGFTPRHQHPYEHEVFVLEGEGVVLEGDAEHALRPGVVVFVQPDEIHQFRNTGSHPLKFLCLVPHAATQPNVPVVPECGTEETASSDS
jgi:quercetin dioxygenase-like cupin family protein